MNFFKSLTNKIARAANYLLSSDSTLIVAVILATISVTLSPKIIVGQTNSAKQLAGLWEAKRRFGPDVRGTLLIYQRSGKWQAEIAGRTMQAKVSDNSISFELPDGQGKLQGKFGARRAKIIGHWIQPIMVTNGMPFASPVMLAKDGQNIWRGEVSPLDDEFTFYLMIKPKADGSTGAFLRNPERNLGRFVRVDHIERDGGGSIKLFAADSTGKKGRVLAEGKYDTDSETISVYFPSRGETYDFKRAAAHQMSEFYPRGRPTGNYIYTPPIATGDGWQTDSLESVGIARDKIEKFIQMIIDTPMDSVGSQEIHGVLIARRGKLVLEEYFHGENRDKAHDTRSAAKSLTSTLFGAAIKAGVPVNIATPVYQVMNGGAFAPDLEARKKALKVENLLTQSSGLDCDDSDDNSPGNEQNMLDQTAQPDYYKYTLDLKTIRNPGEKAVYCSVQANLVGGIIQRASKQSLSLLFQNLLAEPLQIKHYYLPLAPSGDAYMGGGVRLLPRDFIKFGQLYLNGGVWNGRKILTSDWVQRATAYSINMGSKKYGYLWWLAEYPYKGRTVRAFYADGNGGQYLIAIPELDLVIAFYGGNYADAASVTPQRVYVPQYILPAIEN